MAENTCKNTRNTSGNTSAHTINGGNPPRNTQNTENTEKAMGRGYTMHSPLFGLCWLRPHGIDETPNALVGYVEFEGRPGALEVAIWQDGCWRNRNLKPLHAPIVTWYSVEREDGTPVL